MSHILQFTRPLTIGCLLFFAWACLPACRQQVTQEGTAAAAKSAAPGEAAMPLPDGGPLDPNRPAEVATPAGVQPPGAKPPQDLQYKTLQNPDGTWGYDIFGDGRRMLHQPHIPALPGTAGFATEAQAVRVAAAVIQKIKNGESLPTLSAEEVRGFMTN